MILTSISLGNLIITEPMTSLTDVFLSVIAFILFSKVKKNCTKGFFFNSWALFFLFMGISTSIGTFAHGFNEEWGSKVHNILWMLMNISVSMAVFFSMQATIIFIGAEKFWNRLFLIINIVILIGFVIATLAWNKFEILKIHTGIGVALIFTTHVIATIKNHFGSGWIVAAFSLSLLTLLIHSYQISVSEWFNFKDISHVFMMMSLVLIYIGVYRMSRNTDLSFRRENLTN
ncbi:MAG: hypothetical protein IPG60_14565 [Bacteroidetes bacterium]|nr:hypothetical protein [Bacteroidota bacterium]MBP7398329.1 hypothetical protein [Chitinophagales bacterium]MBK7110156.1 hypothetical protein [Bacteroidota bacterium]MBK8680503.1 hypothetical protein [Bacteroidota bacterium]MBP8753486.1 hypothetical protein [Chitinophagales bacterium]